MTGFQPQSYSQDELTRIVLNAGENDYVDAKRAMRWDGKIESAGLAKDIAAFANSRDGGFLVVGKAEAQPGSFEIVGLSDEEASSFETTKVANWLNSHFSPPIRQTCYRVAHDGKELVVIRVNEFGDIPSICTKRFDNPGDPKKKPLLEKGRLYIRGANAESKTLQEESELRELIGLAAKKQGDVLLERFNAMLKGNVHAGVITNQEQVENEIAQIQSDLRSRGKADFEDGWTFRFHPTVYEQRWDDLSTLEEHIRTKASRRPDRFPASQTGTFRTEWGIANDAYGETWALSRSGVFFCHMPFREDGEHELERIRQHVLETARRKNQWKFQRFAESINDFRWIEFKWSMEIVVKAFSS
jgi:hypothetical protein